jgi:hypothetical protein
MQLGMMRENVLTVVHGLEPDDWRAGQQTIGGWAARS